MSTLSTTNLKNPSSGSNNIVLGADGSATITTLTGTTITGTSVRGGITSGTAVASTSGTSIDFTSIPSWVKRVTVMFDAVSTNGSSNWLVQLGDSGGIENTGYTSVGAYLGASTAGTSYTSGFGFPMTSSNHVGQGFFTICNLSGNAWAANGNLSGSGGAAGFEYLTSGSKTLSATLDRVRITTANGTDTFDAGSINILYEG